MNEQRFVKIPLKGKYGKGKYALVDGDYDGEYFKQYDWYVSDQGYAFRGEKKNRIFLHREVARTPTGLVTDHINRNRLDNRTANLRWATHSENSQNQDFANKKQFIQVSPKTNLPRGVSLVNKYKGIGSYEDRWRVKFRGKHIGIFRSKEEAASAYNEKALEYFGENALLNIL